MDKNGSRKRKRDTGDAGRCSKAKSKRVYAKKRKYHGGRKKSTESENVGDRVNENVPETSTETTKTASSSKIVDIEVDNSPAITSATKASTSSSADTPSGYRMIDVSILANIFHLVCCPGCKDDKSLRLSDINSEKKGLARLMQIKCSSCLYTKTFFTSKQIGASKKGGRNPFDINIRSVYACRQIGAGHEHLKKMCAYLNMPSPMLYTNYTKISNKLKVAAKEVAETSMAAAASDLRGDGETADVGVSVDGTWQRKGYVSMNGVITAISVDTGKVLDTAILSKNCKACTSMESKRLDEPEAYQTLYEKH